MKLNVIRKQGLAETLELVCPLCKKASTFCTSKTVSGDKSHNEVNVRSVYAAQTSGMHHSGLKTFCNVMDLPAPIVRKDFNNINIFIETEATKKAKECLREAGQRLHNLTVDIYPEDVNFAPGGDIIANVAVTVDGTWQKRGHTSKIGIVFLLSVETSEVLDYEVRSLICHECVSAKSMNSPENFLMWYAEHKDSCLIKHEGSSDSMKSQCAKEIFLRSVDFHGLRYTTWRQLMFW